MSSSGVSGRPADDRRPSSERPPVASRSRSASGPRPRNDYSQHFVDTGQRPQNYIYEPDMPERLEAYPKLKKLIELKDAQIAAHAGPPQYLRCDLRTFDLDSLDMKFDVIMIDPPWEEYRRRCPASRMDTWTFEQIQQLRVDVVSDSPSFVLIWCGSEEGLDQGRLLLKHWGFRRAEDICWLKTNKLGQDSRQPSSSRFIFHHTKEHCLMGIKGTVRRNVDGHLIHANIDTDIIIAPEPPLGSIEKPREIFDIVERFSLGRRRLHLFGTDSTIRRGWLTLGPALTGSNFNAERYRAEFSEGHLMASSADIESLRPRSPPHK